ncbi:hypothetical protein BDZ97DRAFT_1921246 [Flammula alnicola]|nr:hypothetical protein BDZ97DRAFT_1921246 [Flammula alnicola]
MSNPGSATPRAHVMFSPLPPSSPLAPSSPLSSAPQSSPHQQSPSLPFTSYPQPHLPLSSPCRPRSYSLPPLSSDDIIRSPPIVGTAAQRTALSHQKGQVKHAVTMEINRQALFHEQKKKHEAGETALRMAEEEKQAYFLTILQGLHQRGYLFGQLVTFVSDPIFKQGFTRWEGMLKDTGFVPRILDLWAFKSSDTT